MSVDPQVIRSERHREIAALIRRDAGILIERWRRRAVEEQPNARRVHESVLLDEMPDFLRALARSLAEADEPEVLLHRQPAREHGAQRWEAGWSLPEVIRDYQILRLVILEYLDEALERPVTSRESMAVGLALDEAITASVGRYVATREEYIREVERERSRREKEAEEALAEALRESDRRKNEFLAILSHELRNSLAPVLNAMEVLHLQGPPDDTVRQVRDLVERQVRQMARLVDDLLDVSRLSRGQVELRKERLDLLSAVARAVETSAPLIKARNHHLEVSLPAETLWVEGDRDRLVQIISNLLNNAAKYTDPGGRIWLTGAREDGELVIRVKDTGIGIPPDMLTQVFELFCQVHRSPERSQGGLGVGLNLVRQLVELHGGRVSAASAGPGKGSEFVVHLPVANGESRAPAAAEPAEQGTPGRHVLLIEDHADSRETMQTLLTLLGHRVDVAADGPHGLEVALAARPQVALIDLGLPGMDGYQVAQKLRTALGDRIYLVALTGYGQAEDRRRTLEAGFDAHLVKPVDAGELSRLIQGLRGVGKGPGEREAAPLTPSPSPQGGEGGIEGPSPLGGDGLG